MKMTKSEQAGAALIAAGEVKNRGHAFTILREAGLSGSGAVFNRAVSIYEKHHGCELGKSASAKRADEDKRLRAAAHQMSAADVKRHIETIEEADPLFWACWKVFRNESKWKNTLNTSDFAVHFTPRGA